MSRRTMMAAALAMLAVPETALATPGSDPIFAAIERHRQAWEALNGTGDDHPRLHEAILAAESDLLATRPTTSAGVAALRAYHHEARRRGYQYLHPYPGEYYYPGQYYWRSGKG